MDGNYPWDVGIIPVGDPGFVVSCFGVVFVVSCQESGIFPSIIQFTGEQEESENANLMSI